MLGYREAGAVSRTLGSAYRILRKLGSGGEGAVYLVRHLPTEQLRAAAEIRKQLAEEMLACLIMWSGELYRRGEEENVLRELMEFAGEPELGEKEKARISRQCQKAELAVERAFCREAAVENSLVE